MFFSGFTQVNNLQKCVKIRLSYENELCLAVSDILDHQCLKPIFQITQCSYSVLLQTWKQLLTEAPVIATKHAESLFASEALTLQTLDRIVFHAFLLSIKGDDVSLLVETGQ